MLPRSGSPPSATSTTSPTSARPRRSSTAPPPDLEQLPDSFYADLIQEYQLKREMICAALRVAGMEPSVPAGAYYVLADASVVPGADSVEKAMNLLRLTGVASVPGDAFFQGGRGDHLLRFCFAKTDERSGRMPASGWRDCGAAYRGAKR